MRTQNFRNACSAVLLSCALFVAPAAKASVDYTDIWFTAAESGWGVNFAQTADFIFATFFIYGPNGAPTWYTAQMTRTAGESFSGPVYVVSGTWFGAATFPPVPPANVVAVGDATFTATTSASGTLRYRIDTVTVSKNIERQTTVGQSVADSSYIAGMTRTYSGTCPSTVPPVLSNPVGLVIQTVPNSTALQFGFFGADSANQALFCAMQGTLVQHGKISTAAGVIYQCQGGLSTAADIESLRVLDNGIEMHWHANVTSTCLETGRLAGVK